MLPLPKAENLSRAWGYMTVDEIRELGRLTRLFINDPVIVNVGSGVGTSGMVFRESRPNSIIYTIDISPGGPLGGLENEVNAFHGTGLTLPIQILGDSRSIGKSWKDEIDLLFIDDGHLEPEIRGDIDAWLPHLKKGGLVAFHDYEAGHWPAIKVVIDELFAPDQPLGKKFVKFSKVYTLITYKKKGASLLK